MNVLLFQRRDGTGYIDQWEQKGNGESFEHYRVSYQFYGHDSRLGNRSVYLSFEMALRWGITYLQYSRYCLWTKRVLTT